MPSLLQYRAAYEIKLHNQGEDNQAASKHPSLLRFDGVQRDNPVKMMVKVNASDPMALQICMWHCRYVCVVVAGCKLICSFEVIEISYNMDLFEVDRVTCKKL